MIKTTVKNEMICPICGNSMAIGFAIKLHIESGHLYFAPQPLINNKTLEFIPVFKCIKCGHSITNRE